MIIGFLTTEEEPTFDCSLFLSFIQNFSSYIYIIFNPITQQVGLVSSGEITSERPDKRVIYPLIGILPPLYPEYLGDPAFIAAHQLRFPYVGGSMARGIASVPLVSELAQAGMLGFFGAAGLSPIRVEKEIQALIEALDPQGLSWGVNLIHSPQEPRLEFELVELFLKKEVRRVEASAFLKLEPSVVYYSTHGLKRDPDTHKIVRKNHLFAKISREEVARHFLSPPPESLLERLLNQQKITEEEFKLARQIPICSDLTVEADSGGHTDNRPLGPLFSTISHLRDELQVHYGYKHIDPVRIGAAGGLGTPAAIASAFALGAAYVLIGSIHQSCQESGLSADGKQMLAKAKMTDVIMTASADMFEMGVKVQVLKRGIMMGMRGNLLYDLYTHYSHIEAIPPSTIKELERTIFWKPVDEIWQETINFFKQVDPSQITRAETDAKHRMALIFRWYLGNSSRWPIQGTVERKIDYQIWCGPAMGAFNQWVKGSFLEQPSERKIKQVALNLMVGAAQITRAQQLKSLGVGLPLEAFSYKPILFDFS